MITLPPPVPTRNFSDFQERLEPQWLEQRFASILDRIEQAAGDTDAIVDALWEFNGLSRHVRTHVVRANLEFRLHSTDAGIAAENRRHSVEVMPVMSAARRRLAGMVGDAVDPEALAEHFPAHWFRKLALQATAGSDATARLQGQIEDHVMAYTSTVAAGRFEYEGSSRPLSHARRAAIDPDDTLRRDAFHSYIEWWEQAAPTLQDAFDGVLEARQEVAQLLGMPGYAPVRYADLGRLDWSPAEAGRFRDAVAEHLMPLALRIRRAQAKELGSIRVHPSDSGYFPGSSIPDLRVRPEDELEAASRAFHRLDPKLGRMIDQTIADGRADVLTRDGKAPGAYVATFHDQGLPFVYLNNVGIGRDVKTLVHEFGHAFQTLLSAPIELVDLRKPTLEACEVHSMTLEMLTLPHVDELLHEDDLERYRYDLLAQGVLHTGMSSALDAFQHLLYREDGSWPDRDERADAWRGLAEVFLPGIDHDATPWWSANRWLTTRHVFLFPFYYLDYALAQVVAWQFLPLMEADPEAAMERYLGICRAGGTAPFTELVEQAGLANPFDPETVARVAADLATRLDLVGAPA